MPGRGLKVLANRVVLSSALMVVIAACGCSGPGLPAAPAEAAEVHCAACGQRFARGSTQSIISPEGIDVYYCNKCKQKPGRRKS